MSDQVLFEAKDNVALLTLNRPEKLNALSYEVNDLLMKLLDGVEDDDSIRARSRFQLVDSRSTDFSPIVMNGLFDDSCLKSIWSSAKTRCKFATLDLATADLCLTTKSARAFFAS